MDCKRGKERERERRKGGKIAWREGRREKRIKLGREEKG